MKDDLTVLMKIIYWVLCHVPVFLLGLVSLLAVGFILYVGIKLA
jgi:hypothetical protein